MAFVTFIGCSILIYAWGYMEFCLINKIESAHWIKCINRIFSLSRSLVLWKLNNDWSRIAGVLQHLFIHSFILNCEITFKRAIEINKLRTHKDQAHNVQQKFVISYITQSTISLWQIYASLSFRLLFGWSAPAINLSPLSVIIIAVFF